MRGIVVWLVLSVVMTTVMAQPLVLVSGKYADPHAALLEELGAKVRWVSLEQLEEGVGLERATMVLLAHTERSLTKSVEKRLANFVRNGGILFLELTPPPTGELAPPVPHRFVWGWTPDLELTKPDDPLFARIPTKQKIWRYNAWGAGVFIDDEFALARWVFPQDRKFGIQPSEVFRQQPAAIARWKLGNGQVIFVGPASALIDSTRPLARSLLIALLGEEKLPVMQLVKRIEVPVKVAQDAKGLKGQTVGIFREPNFPRIGLPEDVTPEFIASTLRRHGIEVTFLSASDLASPNQLNARRINTLVLSYGPAVPLEALPTIKQFLAEGGGLVSPAGIPLSRPMVKEGNRWVDAFAELEIGTLKALFQNLLPFAKAYKARKRPRFCVVLRPDLLPNLPPLWHIPSGEWAVIPIVDGSQHLAEPLLVSVSEDGDVVALPLVIAYRFRQYPCARIVALGFWGNSHPWSKKVWKFAEAAIVDTVRLALRRDYIAIRDLMSDQPCYLPKETVNLTAELVCPVDISANCQLLIRERDTGKIVHQVKRKVFLEGGKPETVTFEWRIPSDPHWAYDAILTAENPSQMKFHERTMFLVRSERTLAMVRQATPYKREIPSVVSGVNLYTNDPRGIGAYFDSEQRLGKHPLPDIWDREISLVRLYGGNAIRQHYYERILNEEVFADENYNWAKRVLDANHILLAVHDVAALTNPFTFSPTYYWRKRLGEGDPYTDEKWLQAEEAYMRGLAKWLADFPNVMWELINEPEGYGIDATTHKERRQFAERVANWCRRMSQAIFDGQGYETPIGIGLAWAPNSPVWSVRHFLNFLKWSHAHHYHDNLGAGLWTLPFALAYGHPCIIGEAGMPNAVNSPHPLLREWGEIYEQMLYVALGERALGFLNFYLNNTLQHPDAPEWGMMRHDGTERESCRVWARWSFLLRHLQTREFLPPTVAILIDTDSLLQSPSSILTEARNMHMQLLENGVPSMIVSEHDLSRWQSMLKFEPKRWQEEVGLRIVIIPRSAKPLDETWKLLRELWDLAKRADTSMEIVALCEPRPEWARAELPTLGAEIFGLKVERGLAHLIYPLRKRNGLTVVLVNGNGKTGEIEYYGCRVRLTIPKGRCALLDFRESFGMGKLTLISAYGSVTVNGKPLAKAPDDLAWVAVGDLTLDKELPPTPVTLWSDNQRAIELTVPVENDVKGLKQLTIYAPTQFSDVAKLVAQSLQEVGVKAKIVNRLSFPLKGNTIVIDQATKNLSLAELVTERFGIHFVGHEGWSHWRKGTMRIWQPWSGLILSDRDKKGDCLIVLTGHTEASVRIAALKFRTIRSLGNYCAAPFCSL